MAVDCGGTATENQRYRSKQTQRSATHEEFDHKARHRSLSSLTRLRNHCGETVQVLVAQFTLLIGEERVYDLFRKSLEKVSSEVLILYHCGNILTLICEFVKAFDNFY